MSKITVKLSTLALIGLSTLAISSASALEKDLGKSSMTANVGGLLQLDGSMYISDNNTNGTFKDGAEMRRTDLSVYGKVGDWTYKAGGGKGANDAFVFEDAYIGFDALGANFSLGWMCPEFGMENTTSSVYVNSLERSHSGQAFSVGPMLGLMFDKHFGAVKATFGIFSLDRAQNASAMIGASSLEPAFAARLTYMGKDMPGDAWHGGISAYFADPDDEWVGNESSTYEIFGVENLGVRGLSYAKDEFGLYANKTSKLRSDLRIVGEFAWVRNSIAFTAEGYYGRRNFSDTGLAKPDDVKGVTAELSWVVTGESRMYNSNMRTIAGVMPSSADMGAFEVFARYSYLDLTTDNVIDNADDGTNVYLSNGSAVFDANGSNSKKWVVLQSLTGGVTWYANEHASLKANAVINWLPNATGSKLFGDKKETSRLLVGGAVRAQISW